MSEKEVLSIKHIVLLVIISKGADNDGFYMVDSDEINDALFLHKHDFIDMNDNKAKITKRGELMLSECRLLK